MRYRRCEVSGRALIFLHWVGKVIMNKRSIIILFTIFVVTSISWGGDTIMQETVSTTFFKDDKPYGAGDFKIRGNQVISLKLAQAETVFKPGSAEYTEAWMNDINEQINRRSVRILTGTIGGTVRRVFDKPGQHGAWWLSPDWNVIYVSTGWADYHLQPELSERYTPQLTELFKSSDQGHTWQQLNWSKDANIGQINFLDKQRGYVTGWGPHIWRTEDGGINWEEIPVPLLAKDPKNMRKKFDMVALGKDGVLRFSFTTQNQQQQTAESQVYALGWNDTAPSFAFSLLGQVVVEIIDYQDNLYILSWRGTSVFDVEENPPKTSIFRFVKQRVELFYQFTEAFRGYVLYITPGGGILTGGERQKGFMSLPMMALSYDQGKSWKIEDEGSSYFDAETGINWRVRAYSLYKSQIP